MKQLLIAITLSCIIAGCTVTGRLERKGYNAVARYTNAKPDADTAVTGSPVHIAVTKKDPVSYKRHKNTTSSNGEVMWSMELPEVTVVARSKTVPERGGKVDIDFVVTLPRQLQGSCRSIAVTPVLHETGKRKPLQEIMIRGTLFDRVQARDYWQYGRYIELFDPDSTKSAKAFDRFIRYPYPEGVRLDSVTTHAEDISYYYRQQIPTAQAGSTLHVTLEGCVTGLDGSRYVLPQSDTLEYNISSMLTFRDTTPRFVTRIIEKYVEVSDRNYLSFPLGESIIIDSLGDNAEQMQSISDLMQQLLGQREFYIDSVVMTASASPEGSYKLNTTLSRARAAALRQKLAEQFPAYRIDTLITVRTIPEAWDELRERILSDDSLQNKEDIIALWQKHKDPDIREEAIRQRFPQQYKYIKETIYPALRNVTFRYDLRRIGMVKDTIHTTEPDTRYAHGIELMDRRQYTEALTILEPYADRNTAIVLLSLGEDSLALDILCKLQDNDPYVLYLRAIAYSRLGYDTQAAEAFKASCLIDPNLEFRAGLDPELSHLIR